MASQKPLPAFFFKNASARSYREVGRSDCSSLSNCTRSSSVNSFLCQRRIEQTASQRSGQYSCCDISLQAVASSSCNSRLCQRLGSFSAKDERTSSRPKPPLLSIVTHICR